LGERKDEEVTHRSDFVFVTKPGKKDSVSNHTHLVFNNDKLLDMSARVRREKKEEDRK